MKSKFLLAAALCMGGLTATLSPAAAFPVAPLSAPGVEIEHVAMGCGPGGFRNPWGRCVYRGYGYGYGGRGGYYGGGRGGYYGGGRGGYYGGGHGGFRGGGHGGFRGGGHGGFRGGGHGGFHGRR